MILFHISFRFALYSHPWLLHDCDEQSDVPDDDGDFKKTEGSDDDDEVEVDDDEDDEEEVDEDDDGIEVDEYLDLAMICKKKLFIN